MGGGLDNTIFKKLLLETNSTDRSTLVLFQVQTDEHVRVQKRTYSFLIEILFYDVQVHVTPRNCFQALMPKYMCT